MLMTKAEISNLYIKRKKEENLSVSKLVFSIMTTLCSSKWEKESKRGKSEKGNNKKMEKWNRKNIKNIN